MPSIWGDRGGTSQSLPHLSRRVFSFARRPKGKHMDYKAIIVRLLGIDLEDIWDFVIGKTMIFVTYIQDDQVHHKKFFIKDLQGK